MIIVGAALTLGKLGGNHTVQGVRCERRCPATCVPIKYRKVTGTVCPRGAKQRGHVQLRQDARMGCPRGKRAFQWDGDEVSGAPSEGCTSVAGGGTPRA